MMLSSLRDKRCDHPSCPAPAQRIAILYGQDFYFCGHHAAELGDLLVATPADSAPPEAAEGAAASSCRAAPAPEGRPAAR